MLDSKDILTNFGKFIRRHREISGINQVDVANAVGMSQPQYSRIESGERRVDLDLAIKLCVFVRADLKNFIATYIEKEE